MHGPVDMTQPTGGGSLADSALDAEGTTRRGALGKFGKISAATLVGLFGAAATAPQAAAGNWNCCQLALPDTWCDGSGGSWSCPWAYHATFWTCCQGGRVIGCGECQIGGGSDCWGGANYACSYGWVEQALC